MRNIIDCRILQEEIKEEIRQEIKRMGITPILTIIQVGDDYASNKYINQKLIHCDSVGIATKHIKLDATVQEKDLIEIIKMENCGESNAIIVQLPLPAHIKEELVLEAVNMIKDVDCLTSSNTGLLHLGKSYLEPCTAKGVMEVLSRTGIATSGKRVLIVGRSHIVGRPLAELFIQGNATVTLAHSRTNMEECLKQEYDIIVSAIGKPKYFKGLKADVLIDVGINYDENNKMVGDIDLDSCEFNYATPVPNGVGRMTVACLLQNIVKSAHMINLMNEEPKKVG